MSDRAVLARLSQQDSDYVVVLESIHRMQVRISLKSSPSSEEDTKSLYAVAEFVESCFVTQMPNIVITAERKSNENSFRFILHGRVDYGFTPNVVYPIFIDDNTAQMLTVANYINYYRELFSNVCRDRT